MLNASTPPFLGSQVVSAGGALVETPAALVTGLALGWWAELTADGRPAAPLDQRWPGAGS